MRLNQSNYCEDSWFMVRLREISGLVEPTFLAPLIEIDTSCLRRAAADRGRISKPFSGRRVLKTYEDKGIIYDGVSG